MKVDLKAAFVTHHHWDHAGGTEELFGAYPKDSIFIYGGDAERIKCVNALLSVDGSEFKLGPC